MSEETFNYSGIKMQAESLGFGGIAMRDVKEDPAGWEARIAERIAEQAKEPLPWSENPAVPRNEPPIGSRIWFTNHRLLWGRLSGESLQGAVWVRDRWGWVGSSHRSRWTWREMLGREDMLKNPRDFIVLPTCPAGSDIVWGG